MSATGLADRRLAARRGGRRRPSLSLLVLVGLGLIGLIAFALWRLPAAIWYGVTEYAVPASSGIPTAVAVAPDGAVWFTLEDAATLGLVREGRLQTVRRGDQRSVEPYGLAVAADGSVWFTDGGEATIGRLTPQGGLERHQLSWPGSALIRLAVAPDGAVWVADGVRNGLTRLKDGQLQVFEALTVNAKPFGVAVAADGTVWATLQAANKLLRIEPTGAISELAIPSRQAQPGDIAVDASGAVWFAQLRLNRIGRYANGQFSEFELPTPSAGLTSLAVGPDGSVWVTLLRAHKLARLRHGQVTEFALPPGSRGEARPYGVAVDGAGNVWYTDLAGKVGQLPAARATG